MQTWKYRVRFHTPAFLGDADQNGAWRTPPFKAQLRQWWRVAYAARQGFHVNVEQMRRREGLLFGNAWLSRRDGGNTVQDHCRSLVRLRLGEWRSGGLKSTDKWIGESTDFRHPEAPPKKGYDVGGHLYLGYGPLTIRNKKTWLSRQVAIDHGEEAELGIRLPDEDGYRTEIENALMLMHAFGALGSRSRNGWGGFSLEPLDGAPGLPGFQSDKLGAFFRPWQDCLDLKWPHALGCDGNGRPLVWATGPRKDWRAVIRDLAVVRMGVRTQFMLELREESGDKEIRNNRGEQIKIIHGRPQERHWLAYPVTNHDVRPWNRDTDGRLPNTLRFTVRPAADGGLQGVIFHVPCSPPERFRPDRSTLIDVWETVHAMLDELTRDPRQRRYEMITTNRNRRQELRDQLDTVTLKRSKGRCP